MAFCGFISRKVADTWRGYEKVGVSFGAPTRFLLLAYLRLIVVVLLFLLLLLLLLFILLFSATTRDGSEH
jgi:hypothetical protein